jgi:transcriptional regulator with XRE-family HTH domain
MPTATTIRDLREQKNLSQDKVAEAAGLTYSKFVRIEEGSGKTTPEEVKHVMTVLKGMEPGTRKLAGRPFKDPAKQAAVKAARESGGSVAEAIGIVTPAPAKKAPAKKTTAKKAPAKNLAKSLAKKAPVKS